MRARRWVIRMAAVVASLVAAPAALASDPLTWGTPTTVKSSTTLTSISCPSATLCVTADTSGDVFAGDPTKSWTPSNIDPSGTNNLDSVSCPTTSLCATGDGQGEIFDTTTPATGTSGWGAAFPESGVSPGNFAAISCTATPLCVASDDVLNKLYVSSDPTVTNPTYTGVDADSANPIVGLSCPVNPDTGGIACFGADQAGNVVSATATSTTLSNFNSASNWKVTAVDPGNSLTAISCPTTLLCVAVDSAGDVATSDSPASADATQWQRARITTQHLRAVSCWYDGVSIHPLCVAVDGHGDTFDSTNPTGGATAWNENTAVDGTTTLMGVSCPTSGMCVAVDFTGHEIIGRTGGLAAPKFANYIPAPGSPSGASLKNPQGVAMDGSNVIVADTGDNVLKAYQPNGTWIPPTLGPASGTGQLSSPRQAVMVNGELIATSSFGGAVEKIDPTTGAYDGEFDKGGVSWLFPLGIAYGNSPACAYVAVADADNNAVYVFDTSGNLKATLTGAGSGPGALKGPEGVAFDGGCDIWVADTQNHRIIEFVTTGTATWSAGPAWTGSDGGANPFYPTGLDVDQASETIWVADYQNNIVAAFDTSGTLLTTITDAGSGTSLMQPVTVAVDQATGDLYVAAEGNNEVVHYSASGGGGGPTPPVPVTSPVGVTEPAQLDLRGTVNPKGQPGTTWYFQVSTTQNFSSGVTSFPSTPAALGSSANGPVSVPLTFATPLTPGTPYWVRLVAVPQSGPPVYGNVQFVYTAVAPVVTTDSATATETDLTVTGKVSPEELDTHYFVQYGDCQAEGYGNDPNTCLDVMPNDLPASPSGSDDLPATDSSGAYDKAEHQVSIDIPNLTQGQLYCFRLYAVNGAGTTYGYNPATPGYNPSNEGKGLCAFTNSPPVANTEAPNEVHTTWLQLQGTVNPKGQQTHFFFQYGPDANNMPFAIAPSGSVVIPASGPTSQTGDLLADGNGNAYTDNQDHTVITATPENLTPGANYCFRLVAVNPTGIDWNGGTQCATTTVDPSISLEYGDDGQQQYWPPTSTISYTSTYAPPLQWECNAGSYGGSVTDCKVTASGLGNGQSAWVLGESHSQYGGNVDMPALGPDGNADGQWRIDCSENGCSYNITAEVDTSDGTIIENTYSVKVNPVPQQSQSQINLNLSQGLSGMSSSLTPLLDLSQPVVSYRKLTDNQGNVIALIGSDGNVIAGDVIGAGGGNVGTIDTSHYQVIGAGGGNVIGAGGGNFEILKDGKLIGGIISGTPKAGVIGAGGGNIVTPSGNVIGAGGGNIIGAGGGNVVGAGGGNVIGAGGGNIVFVNAAGEENIIGAGGGNVIGAGSGNVIGAGGGNIIAAGAHNIVGIGEGNLVGANLYALPPDQIAQALDTGSSQFAITLGQIDPSQLVGIPDGSLAGVGNGNLVGVSPGAAKDAIAAIARVHKRHVKAGPMLAQGAVGFAPDTKKQVLRLVLTKAGRRALQKLAAENAKLRAHHRRLHHLVLTIGERYTPLHGKSVIATRKITVTPVTPRKRKHK